MNTKILTIFIIVAIFSSLLRFGHRENNWDEVSDSDYYLDMALVFVGEKSEFMPEHKTNRHHYNRPLLAYCAGIIGHYLLGDNYRASFSIINIIAAIFIASLLLIILKSLYPGIANSWYPSLLFLTSFSQMNFGYHILTETIGLAFALGTCYLVYQLLLRFDKSIRENQNYKFYKDCRVYLTFFIILITQTLSFLTRETAWFIFIFLIYIVIKRQLSRKNYLAFLILIFLILIVAKLPHTIYANIYGTHSTPLNYNMKVLIAPKYLFDSVIKLGIIFNISWIIVFLEFLFWKKKLFSHIHEFIIGWSLAAFLYIVAGYLANSMNKFGYPLRMFYSLFPIIFITVVVYFERSYVAKRRMYLMGAFIVLSASIGVIGVILDSGVETIHTIYDLFNLSKLT